MKRRGLFALFGGAAVAAPVAALAKGVAPVESLPMTAAECSARIDSLMHRTLSQVIDPPELERQYKANFIKAFDEKMREYERLDRPWVEVAVVRGEDGLIKSRGA